MTLKMIVATTTNGLIGNQNKLPWHCPEDLASFKQKTNNSVVVMGKNTYLSLPKQNKPLPNRINIVISDTHTMNQNELESSLKVYNRGFLQRLCENHSNGIGMNDDVWVIGGKQVYLEVLPYVDEIHHTEIIHVLGDKPAGDVYFTELFKELKTNFTKAQSLLKCVQPKGNVSMYRETVYHRNK